MTTTSAHVGSAPVTRCQHEDCVGTEAGCLGEHLIGRPCQGSEVRLMTHEAFVAKYGRCPMACRRRVWAPAGREPEPGLAARLGLLLPPGTPPRPPTASRITPVASDDPQLDIVPTQPLTGDPYG